MESARVTEHHWNGLDELRPIVAAYLTRFSHHPAEIDDVVQEALLRAARYRPSLASADSLRPWVLQIARNVLRDRARNEKRLPRVEVQDEELDAIESREHSPGDVPDDRRVVLSGTVVEKETAIDHLERSLRELQPLERAVLDAWYGTSLDCDRAAAVCECAPEMVRVRAWRARRRLTRILCERLVLDESIDWPAEAREGTWLEDSLGARCAQARKAVKRGAKGAAGEMR